MFIPNSVTGITLIVPKDYSDKLVTSLMLTEKFHPAELSIAYPGSYNNEILRYSQEIEGKVNKFSSILSDINIYGIRNGGEIKVSKWIETAKSISAEYDMLEKEIEPIISELKSSKSDREKIDAFLKEIEPLKDLDFDLNEEKKYGYLGFKVGYIDIEMIPSFLEKMRKFNCYIFVVKGEEIIVAVILYKKEDEKEIEKILAESGFSEVVIPKDLPSNFHLAYEELKKKISEFDKKIEELEEKIKAKEVYLKDLYSRMYTVKEALRIYSQIKNTDYFSYVRGYIPAYEAEKIISFIKKALDNRILVIWEEITLKAVKEEKLPTEIKVNKLLKPFSMLVENYGYPLPHEIVPIYFMAITFPIIFGIMFPDLGHGLLVLLFGIYMIKASKGREGWYNTGLLAIYLGIAGMVTGILSGEFFGSLTNLSQLLWNGHPLIPSPFEEGSLSIYFLINISLKIGSILLISGTLFGLINSLMAREYFDAVAIKLPKFLAFSLALYPLLIYSPSVAGGLIKEAVFGGPGFEVMLIRFGVLASLFMLLLFEPLFYVSKKRVKAGISALTTSFIETFETGIMLIGNTASFLRILGLSVAHIGVMYAFTIMALLVWKGTIGAIAGITIYIFGNLLAAALEGIVVFAHTMRLHYYEWFTKFYSGTGIPFKPATPFARIVMI
jgi:V/A-type H+-transporting ATPase subunit I